MGPNQISKGWLKSDDLSLKWILNPPSTSIHFIHFDSFLSIWSRRLAPRFGRSRWQEGLILYSAPWLASGEELAGLVRIFNLSSNIGYWWILLCSHIGLKQIIWCCPFFFVLSISTNPDQKGNAMERNSPQRSFWTRTASHKYLRAFWKVFSEKSDVTPYWWYWRI